MPEFSDYEISPEKRIRIRFRRLDDRFAQSGLYLIPVRKPVPSTVKAQRGKAKRLAHDRASLDPPQPPATNSRQLKSLRLRRCRQAIIGRLPRRRPLQRQQPYGLPHYRRQQHPGPHLRQATIAVPLQNRCPLPHRIHPLHAFAHPVQLPPLRAISPVRITEQPRIRLRVHPNLIALYLVALDAAPRFAPEAASAASQALVRNTYRPGLRHPLRLGLTITNGNYAMTAAYDAPAASTAPVEAGLSASGNRRRPVSRSFTARQLNHRTTRCKLCAFLTGCPPR